jgi:homoserine O-succinyltransferase
MPLEIEVPPGAKRQTDTVVIGLINNMPDGALRATETQFASLLAEAAGTRAVRLRLSYLPEVPRDASAREHLQSVYWPLETLLGDAPDALIVTGTEPRSSQLEQEPYWDRIVELLDWTQAHAKPSIWSCLAAHAAVLALDGIRRQRLPQKRFGIFTHQVTAAHPLLRGAGTSLATPHSRWNELPVESLREAGYTLTSLSPVSGADCFVREGRAPMLCFQGHPEYEGTTLLLEYRRDVGRFLRREQDAWPNLPHDYFSPRALETLATFRARAEALRDPAQITEFPTAELAAGQLARWRPQAIRIYRNWLDQVIDTRERTRAPQHASMMQS